MSRDYPPTREELFHELSNEVRAGQRATDSVDDLVCQLLGINRTDGKCMDILDHYGRMSAGELAEHSGLSTGAVTSVIDRLERAGYAHRVGDPADRRRVLVELTPEARRKSEELMGGMGERAAAAFPAYTDEQLELLLGFQRLGREIQEQHAAWLRERLRQERDSG